MPPDIPPLAAEQAALDRPWRLWASILVSTFVLVSLGIGFVALPESEEPGLDPLSAICRAIGIPGFGRASAETQITTAASSPRFALTVATRRQIDSGRADRGAAVAAEVCAGCHGENGIPEDASFPHLANQPRASLYKQIQEYKSGSRQGGQAAVMASLVEPLSDQQIADVVAYYASLPAPARVPAGSAVLLPTERLVTLGDPARGVAACDSCHGASRGGPQDSPALLGQSAAYLEQQLQLFASGERNNDLFSRMRVIANQLTADEMRALAIYYRGHAAPRYKPY